MIVRHIVMDEPRKRRLCSARLLEYLYCWRLSLSFQSCETSLRSELLIIQVNENKSACNPEWPYLPSFIHIPGVIAQDSSADVISKNKTLVFIILQRNIWSSSASEMTFSYRRYYLTKPPYNSNPALQPSVKHTTLHISSAVSSPADKKGQVFNISHRKTSHYGDGLSVWPLYSR